MTSLVLLKSFLLASVLQKKTKKKKKIKSRKSISPIKIDLIKCRVCNEEKGEISIFNNCIQSNIPEEIKNFSGVCINKTDNLPKQICQNCLDLLNGCIMFREMCQKTNQHMKEVISPPVVEVSIKKEVDVNGVDEADVNEVDINEVNEEDVNEVNEVNEADVNEVDINEVNEEDVNEVNGVDANKDFMINLNCSDDSCNSPSPTFSDDNSEIWDCTTCKKKCYDMETYYKHLGKCNTQSNDSKPDRKRDKVTFLCDICGKVAQSNANLLIHKAIHENIFPFKCEQCPYQGRTLDLLRVHRRTHLDDKPYKCSQCSKSAITSSNLLRHMRHVHSTTRPFKCTYCEKAFTYQYVMKKHIKEIHLRQGTVECNICLKKFNSKTILQGHRFKIHKIKSERLGRLPSYLQCQIEHPNDGKNSECESVPYQ